MDRSSVGAAASRVDRWHRRGRRRLEYSAGGLLLEESRSQAVAIARLNRNGALIVEVVLDGGARERCAVPSGASSGSGEAVELRDGDPHRYGGMGVSRAVERVNTEIAQLLGSRAWAALVEIDRALVELDGAPNEARLGANATLGVSGAVARALAQARGVALWHWLADQPERARMPVPRFNLVNGGAHADNPLDFQEFMVTPLGAPSCAEAVRAGVEVYAALRTLLTARKGPATVGDEGGLAPDIAAPEEVQGLLVTAIDNAGYSAGRDGVAIALDPAASELRERDGRYRVAGDRLSSAELVLRYANLVTEFPIWSIEDGLGEDDEEGWRLLTERLGEHVQLVGDDVFVTNPARIEQAAEAGVGNAVLIKPNQIGTISECLDAVATCRRIGYRQMVSHRSGETADDLIADLAVAIGCGQLKAGAPARERVAKYNRLLAIEDANPKLPYGIPDHGRAYLVSHQRGGQPSEARPETR